MISYTANVIKNDKSPFSAVTAAIMNSYPRMKRYSEGLLVEFAEMLNKRPKLTAL